MVGPIASLINRMISTHGTNIVRIAFSSVKCKCFNSSKREGEQGCRKCLGKGFIATYKRSRCVVDTYVEMATNSDSALGRGSTQTVKLVSNELIAQGEYVIVYGDVFEISTEYKERYLLGEVEAFISVATDIRELRPILKQLEFKEKEGWHRLE